MKFMISSALLLVVSMACETRACYPIFRPLFPQPRYIDIEFTDESEHQYGHREMAEILWNSYLALLPMDLPPSDSAARRISDSTEHDAYQSYLRASQMFHSANTDSALIIYEHLRDSLGKKQKKYKKSPRNDHYSWVHEASTYMIARCNLIAAQKDLHGYEFQYPKGFPVSKVDHARLSEADSAFQRYLSEYPQGYYSRSASDLNRRILLLSDRTVELNQALKQRMHSPNVHATRRTLHSNYRWESTRNSIRHMVQTGPNSMSSEPMLEPDLRADFLYEFRKHFTGHIDVSVDPPLLVGYRAIDTQLLTVEELHAISKREKDFLSYPGLLKFVLAVGYYRLKSYDSVLAVSDSVPDVSTIMWLSTQLLRSRAFGHTGRSESQIQVLYEMYERCPNATLAVELAVASLNAGQGLRLFSEASPFLAKARIGDQLDTPPYTPGCPLMTGADNTQIRSFVTFGFETAELKQALAGSRLSGTFRSMFVQELSRRLILLGRYKEFLILGEKESLGPLEGAKKFVQAVVNSPGEPAPWADLGEYQFQISLEGRNPEIGEFLSPWGASGEEALLPRCTVCSFPKHRSDSLIRPLTLFNKAISLSRKKGIRSEAEAKSLHYIVMGGRSESFAHERLDWSYVDRSDSAFARSKAAFQRLHRLYKDSKWAKATPYYYQ